MPLKRKNTILLTAIILVLSMVAFIIPVSAGSASVSGTIDTGDPIFNKGWCGSSDHFESYTVTVSTTGTYNISNFTNDTSSQWITVVISTDPTGWGSNTFRADTTGSPASDSETLNAGTTYYANVVNSCSGATGLPISYSFDMSGPGDICINGCPNGTSSATVVIDDTVYPPDNRINWQFGELGAVLYRGTDSTGEPAINIYCWDGENSTLGMQVNATTASGTSANGCDATFYILSNGTYQINITYDGKLYEIFCEDLSCRPPEMRYYDPNE